MTGQAEFIAAFEKWHAADFPTGSTDGELDEIHSILVYVDAMVADAVLPTINGYGSVSAVPDQARVELDDVLVRLSRESVDYSAEMRNKVVSYRTYAKLLVALINEVVKIRSVGREAT